MFVGENLALEDFVRAMQNNNLLETGNYMVVSVNDEIYEKMLDGDILYRSRGEFSILFCQSLINEKLPRNYSKIWKINSKVLRLISTFF